MSRLGLALAVGAVAAVSCTQEPKLQYSGLQIALEQRESLGWSKAELGTRFEKAFAKRRLEKSPKATPALTLKVELVLDEPEGDDDGPSTVYGAVDVKQAREGTVLDVQASAVVKEQPGEEPDAALQAAVEQVMVELAGRTAAGLRASALSTEVLGRELTDADELRREAAIAALAEKKDGRVLEPLVKQVGSTDLTKARRALGQLIALGDAKATPAIIEASRGKDPGFQREVVFALGALGGEEAEAYLDVMAEGHDHPVLREAAQRALDELRARAKPTAKHQEPTP